MGSSRSLLQQQLTAIPNYKRPVNCLHALSPAAALDCWHPTRFQAAGGPARRQWARHASGARLHRSSDGYRLTEATGSFRYKGAGSIGVAGSWGTCVGMAQQGCAGMAQALATGLSKQQDRGARDKEGRADGDQETRRLPEAHVSHMPHHQLPHERMLSSHRCMLLTVPDRMQQRRAKFDDQRHEHAH